MKIITGLFLLLFCSSFILPINYPVAKLYAYQQKVSSGANISGSEKKASKTIEYIYLLIKQTRSIEIESVWVNGTAVGFRTEEIKSPVKVDAGISFSGNAEETLVQETKHNVLQIFIDDKNIDAAPEIPKRYAAFPLLIKYSEGKNTFFLGSKNWKTLAAKVNQ